MNMVILFGSLLLLILIGMPIGYAIGFSTWITLITCSDIPLKLITQNAYAGVDSFPLMAIPFFILAGVLMTHGGIAKRLIDFFNVFVGRITGGLGMISIVTSLFFGAISGSAMATASAVGAFMIPEMKRANYKDDFAGSLIASAGTIGIIIPPSIPFVIYGVVTGSSIGELFVAGIVPGVLMAVALIIVCYIVSKKNGYGGTKQSDGIWDAFKRSIWALISPIIVLGGIYGGIFTPTEAAVVSVFYSGFVGLVIYRELNLKNLYRALYETIVINGITTFMVGLSMGFASYLSLSQIPTKIAQGLIEITDNPFLLLVLINVFLLVVGCLVDNIPACIILAPILLPVVTNLGMDPIQFGVILTFNLAIGFVTPPYGPNLFISAAVANIPVESMFKAIIPCIIALIVVLAVITYIPAATMGTVMLMRG
ncbi:MAG: TRAP transporter large permease [Clostridiales Family XIII bacterium]|jgi:C4-dicarboxylate transporter DctM subunit|nr:TRAP transporter large permease [Clostridiales Family XIII bacterium]